MGNGDKTTQAIILKKQADSLRALLGKAKGEIQKAIPTHLTPDRLIRVALTAYLQTPALWECSQPSILRAVIQAAQLGLEPDGVLGQAYMVPYWNSRAGQKQAQLQIGYRGLITLARRSKEVSAIWAEVVYANDRFEVSLGTDRKLVHVPNFHEERGNAVGAYAVVRYKDGVTDFEYMSEEEINTIQKSSKAKDTGPWKTHPMEMWRKTPIRRLAKRLPLSAESEPLIKAAVMDEYAEAGVLPDTDDEGLVSGNGQQTAATDEKAQRLKDDCEKLMDILGYNEAQKEMAWSTFEGPERLAKLLLKLKHDLDARNNQLVNDQKVKKAKGKAAPSEQASFEQAEREPGEEG